MSWQLLIRPSVQRRHVPVLQSCGKHQLQGVWGAARPPSGEREGRSPLASMCKAWSVSSAERERWSPLVFTNVSANQVCNLAELME